MKQLIKFFSLVNKNSPNGCWEWEGSRDKDGYGMIWVVNEQRAHRASYAIHVKPIPKGLWVLHKCDNPPCVNPDHLFLGDHRINTQDAVDRNRFRNGWMTGNGVSIKGKFRTECKRGHLFTKENTCISRKGVRSCRTCKNIRAMIYLNKDREKYNKRYREAYAKRKTKQLTKEI